MKTSEAINVCQFMIDNGEKCLGKTEREALTHAIEVMRRSEAALTPPVVDVAKIADRIKFKVSGYSHECGEYVFIASNDTYYAVMELLSAVHAQGYLNAKQLNWRELLIQSETTFCKNFGYDAMAQWVYKDLEELFEAAQEGGKDET